MATLSLDERLLEALVVGGSFYGGGGGGSPQMGRQMGRAALTRGSPRLLDLSDLPPDALLLTVSAVGAPAAGGGHAEPADYVKAVELFQHLTGKKVSGFIANECGGLATVNGWIQSAAAGLPVVDAPCDGRAHPTGAMGSMGLHLLTDYISEQVAVGGSPERGTYLEVFVRGSVEGASAIVRRASVQAGGLVAVAARASGGTVVCYGRVKSKEITTSGGFDTGRVVVMGERVDDGHPGPFISGESGELELSFCNEYVTVEASPGSAARFGAPHPDREPDACSGPATGLGPDAGLGLVTGGESASQPVRLATFPDLIVTMDLRSGMPVSSAEITEGQEVAVVVVPRQRLILGAGVKDPSLYRDVERAVGKDLVSFAFAPAASWP